MWMKTAGSTGGRDPQPGALSRTHLRSAAGNPGSSAVTWKVRIQLAHDHADRGLNDLLCGVREPAF